MDGVERQLRYLHEAGTTDLVFIDDTFNVPLPRFRNILRMMIRNKFQFRWISFFRCSNADEDAFDLMRESGCVGVLLGIESGDNFILKCMNKSATREKYEWGMAKLKGRDIATFVSLICGFPGETKESVTRSIEFVQEAAPTFFNVQLYYHDTRAHPGAGRSSGSKVRATTGGTGPWTGARRRTGRLTCSRTWKTRSRCPSTDSASGASPT